MVITNIARRKEIVGTSEPAHLTVRTPEVACHCSATPDLTITVCSGSKDNRIQCPLDKGSL